MPPIPCFFQVWSPALRYGSEYKNYIEFDFLIVARINQVYIGTNEYPIGGDLYRTAKKVLIEAATSYGQYEFVTKKNIATDNLVTFTETVRARFVRITILEVTSADATSIPIGMNKYELCV